MQTKNSFFFWPIRKKHHVNLLLCKTSAKTSPPLSQSHDKAQAFTSSHAGIRDLSRVAHRRIGTLGRWICLGIRRGSLLFFFLSLFFLFSWNKTSLTSSPSPSPTLPGAVDPFVNSRSSTLVLPKETQKAKKEGKRV